MTVTQELIFPQAPSAAEHLGPHHQHTPIPRQDTRAIIPNCSGQWCSNAQLRPPPTLYNTALYNTGQCNPGNYNVSKNSLGHWVKLECILPSKNAVVNQNQGEGNRLDTMMNAPDHTREHLLNTQDMQAVVCIKYSPQTHCWSLNRVSKISLAMHLSLMELALRIWGCPRHQQLRHWLQRVTGV